jgi:hypothetical protein
LRGSHGPMALSPWGLQRHLRHWCHLIPVTRSDHYSSSCTLISWSRITFEKQTEPHLAYKKVKQSRYRSGVAQSVPGGCFQISWKRHRMVVRFSALSIVRIYPQEIQLVLISVRCWVDSRAIMRSEVFMSMKNSMTPSRIEPATFWFVAQYLNHSNTAVPSSSQYISIVLNLKVLCSFSKS